MKPSKSIARRCQLTGRRNSFRRVEFKISQGLLHSGLGDLRLLPRGRVTKFADDKWDMFDDDEDDDENAISKTEADHKKRIEAAIKGKDPRNQSSALNNYAMFLMRKGRWKEAIKIHEQDIEVSRAASLVRGEAVTHGHIGTCYLSLEDYPHAVEHHQRHLRIATRTPDKLFEGHVAKRVEQCRALCNLGRAYVDWALHTLIPAPPEPGAEHAMPDPSPDIDGGVDLHAEIEAMPEEEDSDSGTPEEPSTAGGAPAEAPSEPLDFAALNKGWLDRERAINMRRTRAAKVGSILPFPHSPAFHLDILLTAPPRCACPCVVCPLVCAHTGRPVPAALRGASPAPRRRRPA